MSSVRARARGAGDKGMLVAQGKDEVASLAHLLEVDDDAEALLCMCWGDLEFVVHGAATEVLVLHLDGSLASGQHGQLPLVRREELVQWLVSRRLVSPAGSPLDSAFWGLAPNVDFVLPGSDPAQVAGKFARAFWTVRTVAPASYEIIGEWAHLLVDDRGLSGVAVPGKLPRLREVLDELGLACEA
ncbi:hypothetical protein [Allokutzneria albata]|uniref:hypothetical protein n=1 Tax=Allokutzneria albata TaxID=211114 RepID=UPI0012DF34EA|nr:hypothetical protein [Allokutzneria albata]